MQRPCCQSPPQGLLQGETYLGTLPVTTDGAGNASFQIDVPLVLEAGQRVTATATDPSGNTSEFSQGLLFAMDPESGPAGGGTETTLHGMLFEMGATVTVAGVPATNVLVQGSTSILATMPPLPAGSVNDVSVVNPSGTSGVVESAWIADFLDVPAGNPFTTSSIELVASESPWASAAVSTASTTPSTLRQSMAVFRAQGRARPLLHAAGLHAARRLRRRALPVGLRRLDRGPGRRGHHGRLRRRQLTAR